MKAIRTIALGACLIVLAACADEEATRPEPADTVFYGGPIITMDEAIPTAEAVAVRDGLIIAVGAEAEIMAYRGETTQAVDLQGRTLLPGFIDAHGHLAILAWTATMVNLASPPVGEVTDMADLQAALAARRDEGGDGWIVGTGYDDSLLAEQRHPTREDLDAISADRPIAIVHVSAHLGVVNSKALELMGVNAETQDPPGGHYRRQEGSAEPNGVLEESALFQMFASMPRPAPEQLVANLAKAQDTYASNGITTAQDGFTQPADLKMLKAAAEQDALFIDVIAYPGVPFAEEMIGDSPVGSYTHRLKIGGVKMILDGSPQGKTAYLSQPYFVPPEGQGPDYRGYPAMPNDQVDEWVDRFYAKGWQVLAHANGDAAADQLIHAVEKAEAAHPGSDRRTVMIHAQTVRDDQLDAMARLGIIPSFFSAHPFFWGDWHRDSVLGPERAYRIDPAASAGQRGIPYTMHNDAPVVPPDMTRLLWVSVNRRSRTGDIIGPAERISPMEALQAVTVNAARQNFEEDEKGSITPGKRADLVVLSDNPLTVDPMTIKDIEVVETFKDGVSIFNKPGP